MLLGKIIGRLTASIIYEGLEGVPLLLVQPLSPEKKEIGKTIVACDSTLQADIGQIIYYESGREAAMALEETFVPVDHTIIGIVDGITHKPIKSVKL